LWPKVVHNKTNSHILICSCHFEVMPDGYEQCAFHEETCTVDLLVQALNDTMQNITMKYLMGYNEPYASHQEASSYGSKSLKGVNGTEVTDCTFQKQNIVNASAIQYPPHVPA
jgi:hypothetical protein